MAFDKLIIKSITGAAKSGIKMDLAVDSLKEKMIDNIASQVEDSIPVQLPVDVRSTLLGEDLPTDLMSPETVNSVPPIPPTQKPQINATLDSIENTLNTVIAQKNSLQGALNTITGPLTTLETLSNTIGGIIVGLKVAVTIIKALPIPTSVPPGVGIPVNVINGFSDALDTLSTVLDKFGGPLLIIPLAIQQINAILVPLVEKLASLDPIFDKIIKIIAFIRLLLSLPLDGNVYKWDGSNWNLSTRPEIDPPNSLYGFFGDPNGQISGDFIDQYYFDNNGSQGVQQSDIDAALNVVTNGVQQSLAVTAGPLLSTSDLNANGIANQALLDQLDENSNNPLFYRGFRLIIEFDPNNTFSFPARRVKGYNEEEGITLYSVPPDQGAGEVNTSSTYSFSTSVQVLIEEVKYNIDQYFINKSRTNQIQPVINSIELKIRGKFTYLQQVIQQRNLSIQNNDGRLDESLARIIYQLQNEINSLNTDLEYWKNQLALTENN